MHSSELVWNELTSKWEVLGSPSDVLVTEAGSATLTNKTLTAPTIVGATVTGQVVGTLGTQSQEVLVATRVLTAADSGKTLFLSHATEFDTKLPAPAAGLRFKFIVGLAPSGANYTITTNGTTQNVIHGIISPSEDAAGQGPNTSGTPVDVVTFVASKSQVGDWVELECDGTLWYLRGGCVQQDAITLA